MALERPRLFAAVPVCTAMRCVGMLHWDAERCPWLPPVYQWLARAVVLLAAAVSLLVTLAAPAEAVMLGEGLVASCEDASCWRQAGLLSQLPSVVGAVLALVPFGFRANQIRFEQMLRFVRGVSAERGYHAWEAHLHRWDLTIFVAMWVSTVAAAGSSDDGQAALVAMRVFSTAICSAIILSLSYGIVYICRSLIVMVDTFSGDIVATKRLAEVAHIWNLTQAVLRKSSIDVEKCLLVLGFVLAVAVPLLVADIALLGVSGARLVPGLLVCCGIIYALLVAAMVSERCGRIPAFVNAISFGPGTERMRQHTVDYITSSAAGFYVFDTRLTTSMVTKMMYIWCIVVAGGLTRLVAQPP